MVLRLQVPPQRETVDLCGFRLTWQDPQQGLISPAQFIPILEDTGLIIPVGEWVLQSVCMQIKEWQRQGIKPRKPRAARTL